MHRGGNMTDSELFEIEMVIRDFLAVLNDGRTDELRAFLTQQVSYAPSATCTALGQIAVIALISDMRDRFVNWDAEVVILAASRNVVLAEISMCISIPARRPQRMKNLASFHMDGFLITSWNHLQV